MPPRNPPTAYQYLAPAAREIVRKYASESWRFKSADDALNWIVQDWAQLKQRAIADAAPQEEAA